MIAEILVTGQEILTGSVIDTNSAHIAQTLEEAGLAVTRLADEHGRAVRVRWKAEPLTGGRNQPRGRLHTPLQR